MSRQQTTVDVIGSIPVPGISFGSRLNALRGIPFMDADLRWQAPGEPPGAIVAPVLSGVLFFLAFPPFSFVPAPFVALVPWICSLSGSSNGPRGRWLAVRGGFVFGLTANGLLLHWLVVALWPDPRAVPTYVAIVVVLALVPAAVGWAVRLTADRLRLGTLAAIAVFWTTGEWLLAHLPGVSFPWLGLGTALAVHPVPASAAELVGARGLTLIVVVVNGLIAEALVRRRGRVVRGAAAATMVLALTAFGLWRHRTIVVEPAARVAAVQTSIPRGAKHDRRVVRDANLATLEALTDSVAALGVDLVVWPEVAVPVALDDPAESARVARLQAIARRAGVPIVIGAYASAASDPARDGRFGPGSGEARRYNAAFLVSDAGTTVMHLKRHLVPVIERAPRLVPRLLLGRIGGNLDYGGLTPGVPMPIVSAGPVLAGVLICYESAFGEVARRHRLNGAQVLLNITNDAWFSTPGGLATIGLWQHALHARMRAIENRVSVVRSANRGFTRVVDPLGRVRESAPWGVDAAAVAAVTTTRLVTLYTRWGDWLATGAAATALLLLIAAAGQRRPPPAAPQPRPQRGNRPSGSGGDYEIGGFARDVVVSEERLDHGGGDDAMGPPVEGCRPE